MADFPPIGHVAITVTDIDASRAWYRRLFDTDPVLDEDAGGFYHVVFSLRGTLFGIHGHEGTVGGDRFDERRVGLDHVSFACADRDEIETWQRHLDDLGIDHSPIVDAPYGSGLSFRDPDNNALEFFALPS